MEQYQTHIMAIIVQSLLDKTYDEKNYKRLLTAVLDNFKLSELHLVFHTRGHTTHAAICTVKSETAPTQSRCSLQLDLLVVYTNFACVPTYTSPKNCECEVLQLVLDCDLWTSSLSPIFVSVHEARRVQGRGVDREH